MPWTSIGNRLGRKLARIVLLTRKCNQVNATAADRAVLRALATDVEVQEWLDSINPQHLAGHV
jgi:hypothetical protein